MKLKLLSNIPWLLGAGLLVLTTGCNDPMWKNGYIPAYPTQPLIPQVAMPETLPAPASPTPLTLEFRAPGEKLPGWKEDQGKTNPAANDPDSVKRGEDAYEASCTICHGQTGKGDGMNAQYLPLRPRNLTQGVYLYGGEDWQLFRTIQEGIPPGPMMPWKSVLDEKTTWDVVNYVKSLRQTPAPSAAGSNQPDAGITATASTSESGGAPAASESSSASPAPDTASPAAK